VSNRPGARATDADGAPGVLARACFLLGGGAVLAAMTCDAAAVIGRRIGVPLVGSLEIVQTCIVVLASAAVVGTSLSRAHAAVHILQERAGPRLRAGLQRAGDLASAAFFFAVFAGSAWIAWDLRAGHERTDVLHMPVIAMRLAWCAAALACGALFLRRAFTGAGGDNGDER
jgi:TRAP-type C4-dicarboxylate transport system permease small subunit